jgi:hypothetical protein
MTIQRYFFSIHEMAEVEDPDGPLVAYDDHAAEMAAAKARIAELTKERDQARMERNLKEIRLYETKQERNAAVKRVGELEREAEDMQQVYAACCQTEINAIDALRRAEAERDAALAEVAKLKAQRETMLGWLQQHAEHKAWCSWEDFADRIVCTCGLSAALAAGNDRDAAKGDAT